MTAKRVVMIGNGGHARVLTAVLTLTARAPTLVALPAADLPGTDREACISDDELVAARVEDHILANGVGGVDVPRGRTAVYRRFRDAGFEFLSVIHPQAILAGDVATGGGLQVMAGAIVQAAAKVGENVILNTRCVIEHDCVIGDHVHVATGAILAGGVRVGAMTMIGAGATVRQGVTIGSGVLVAAGAVVVRDVADGERVAGVPARSMLSTRR